MTRWVNNFLQKCQFKSFDQWKLTLIFSPYKPELSMIRICPNRLEFKNKCYSTVNQSISKKISICINFMGRTKTKPFLKRKKVPKLYFHFWPPKKCPPWLLLFNTYLVMWKYNCEPLWSNPTITILNHYQTLVQNIRKHNPRLVLTFFYSIFTVELPAGIIQFWSYLLWYL